MKRQAYLSTTLACVMTLAAQASAQQPPTLPRFTTSVELTSLDASVFDEAGRPIADLMPADFVVQVDGKPRRVVSAQWVPLSGPPGQPSVEVPESYSSNQHGTGGRLILLVIDQPNIRFGGTATIRSTVYNFIDRLQPTDRAAVVGIGPGSPSTPFTADRDRLKKAVERMVGQHIPTGFRQYTIGVAEAMSIRNGTPGALDRVINRECRGAIDSLSPDGSFEMCMSQVEAQASEIAVEGASAGQDTLGTLRNLLSALQAIDAPKTMIFVSEGFLLDNQQSAVIELGTLAAAARTSIYTLKLDDRFLAFDASNARAPISSMDERVVRDEGLELLASSSRGTLLNVLGDARTIFERIEAELSGYYLLGVESGADDRDGRAHALRVNVTRRNSTVRSRRALLLSPESDRPRSPRAAVAAALSIPLPLAAIPLRVATYSLQGPEAPKVQILIHADVGTDYASSRLVSLGYIISDGEGRVVESQATSARLLPIMNGVPSPLQFAGGASLPPGHYTLKLAVAEGDRVGTVEHEFRAGVADAGAVRVSDLMVGGPSTVSAELLQPTIGYNVVFGALHGYLEAYGSAEGTSAKYEIAASTDGEAILSADVPPLMAGDSRAIFTHVMPVRQLPPRQYVLRVTLSSGDNVLNTLTRTFEVSAPAVLMTSATAAGDVVLPVTEVYLPVTDAMLAPPFNRDAITRAATVQAFREKIAETARPAFDRGVQSLSRAAYPEAEASFKSAISVEDDSSAVIAYLAATFAATGHDFEASGAWQTSLIQGSELPEIYHWLSESLMRSRNLAQARATLEEATAKWPSDTRFAKPLALVYATLGQGVQAVRALERHLAEHRDDVEALRVAVEWIYQLRLGGATAHTPAEDVRLARGYADRYLRTKGPQAGLVKQWMEFLEGRKR